VVAVWAARWGHRLAARTQRRWLREGLHVLATGVTGTVEVLRRRSWRVLGTWVEMLAAIGALWAALIAVGEHLPFAVVAMGYLRRGAVPNTTSHQGTLTPKPVLSS
jgi:hypothetical protein